MNILITGGASGLGEAITKALAGDSLNTVFFTYNKSAEKASALEAEYKNAKAIPCDFKNAEDVNNLVEKIPGLNPDILINNAYCEDPIKTHFHKIRKDEFLQSFSENVLPAIFITQACIDCFRKKKSGKIITVLTSFLYALPPIGSAVYVANKAYLASLVKSWASENIKFNITSNSICPSFMATGFTKDVDERLIDQIKEKNPLKRLLTVSEVAEVVRFLTQVTPQMNGTDIPIRLE